MFKQIFLGAFSVLALSGCLDKERQNQLFDGGNQKPPKIRMPVPKLQLEQRAFGSCSEYQQFVANRREQIQNTWDEYYKYLFSQPGGPPMNDPVPSVGAPAQAGPQTNLQEPGVQEADILKGNSKYLFYVGSGAVFIHDKTTKDLVQTIDLGSEFRMTQLYANEDFLALISSRTNTTVVNLKIYKENSSGMWVQVKEKEIQGSLISTRETNGKIIFVSSTWTADVIYPESELQNCTNIFYPVVSDLNESITVASVVDFSDSKDKDHDTVILGGFDQLYAGAEGIYLIRNSLNWFYWDERLASGDNLLFEKMTAVRMELDHDRIVPVSAGVLHGRVRNVWGFKEFPASKSLAVASTFVNPDLPLPTDPDESDSSNSNSPFMPSVPQGENRNQLTVYDFSTPIATKKGQTEEFGKTEDIRAVRYIGNLAYVVTFKKTDPLYTIDLSDLSHPKIVSELKIPGFSAYLHPIGEKALLGIGYDALDEGEFAWVQGLQVSLYDVRDPQKVIEAEKIKMGERGSYAPVVDDHHAFYKDNDIVAFPFLLRENQEGIWGPGKLKETGLAILQVSDAPLALQPVKHLTHKKWISEKCWKWMEDQYSWWTQWTPYSDQVVDINRIYIEGDDVVTFSPLGLQVYSKTDYVTELKEVAYGSHKPACESLPPPYIVD